MTREQGRFSPYDRILLQRQAGVSWIPKEPIELLLPYMEKDPLVEKSDVERRREIAQGVMEDYANIIRRCERLEEEIAVRSKNVTIPLDPEKHHRVKIACARIFGKTPEEVTEITFDMYKVAVHELAKLSETEG